MSKTERNLEEAFTGESRAYQKYLIYVQRAADDYRTVCTNCSWPWRPRRRSTPAAT